MIDKTAIISEGALISKNVSIGQFVVIEDGVIIGENTKILCNCILKKNTVIGKNNYIYENAIIGGDPQDISFDPAIQSYVEIVITILLESTLQFIGPLNFHLQQNWQQKLYYG